jgi:hypothetical protein
MMDKVQKIDCSNIDYMIAHSKQGMVLQVGSG